MCVASMVACVESVATFYAVARICGVRAPPKHAMCRGVLVEGIGNLLAGASGAGCGFGSVGSSIGQLSITGVDINTTLNITINFALCEAFVLKSMDFLHFNLCLILYFTLSPLSPKTDYYVDLLICATSWASNHKFMLL